MSAADPIAESEILSFEPIVNPAPKRLSAEQIEHYNREGYVTPSDPISPINWSI